jgi:hypothetical protein
MILAAAPMLATMMLAPPPWFLDPVRKRWNVIETLALGFWRFLEIESYFLERENDGGEVLCVIGFWLGGGAWCGV